MEKVIRSNTVEKSSQSSSSGINLDDLYPQMLWVCTGKIEQVSPTQQQKQISASMAPTPITAQRLLVFAPIAAKACLLRVLPTKGKITQKPSQNCRN